MEDIKALEYIHDSIMKHWGKFFDIPRFHIPLKELFPKPENAGLRHIWTYGHADIPVFHKKSGKLVAIFEPGGYHQYLSKEDKQARNDRRKWKLGNINGVPIIQVINWSWTNASNRLWRRFLRKSLKGFLNNNNVLHSSRSD